MKKTTTITTLLKDIQPYQYLIWLILIVITIFAIYTPDQLIFKKVAKYSVQLMFGCLVLGLGFLAFRDSKSMWVSLACCGILCLHLRTREPFYPIKYGTFFKIAHVNLSNSSGYENTIDALLKSGADIISLQEIDFDWDYALKEHLTEVYPYEISIIGIGVYNPAIYSKYPFIEIDTFNYKDAPNIHGCVEIDNKNVHFVASMTMPPINMEAYNEIEQHLLEIAAFVSDLNAPVITLGDYNVVTYSSEMNALRTKGGLTDSRRNQSLIGQSPIDHILYSNQLECTDFISLKEEGNSKLGIIGTYQFNRNYAKSKKREPHKKTN